MSRKVVRLTLDHLEALPGPCRDCLFWELDPVTRRRVDDAPAEKRAWLSEVLREWGSCGQVVLVDGEPVGHVLYVPPAYAPGAAGIPTAPVSADAVLLTSLHVDPRHTGGGLGRMLVQGMARDLVLRGGIRAVEAFGTTLPHAVAPCLVPTGFLSAVGFGTQRSHLTNPRMRMELRSALTWKDEVEAALERLLGAVRPAPKAVRPPTSSRGTVSRAARTGPVRR
ncbi:GNAT family N-acetyltransferase [Nocardioides marmotae]|uniref:GNAT family N-acetyltransferase n=1 Tax=Nocardioides marmotae TaxID=2663857 RepID=A0A6I3JDJ9_9ACTN|nr:GNAT family N-acetyltransferase [Nocardioides marmotae]MCR6032638.1 GNAT family N-acetyltransferase [Gordonia jinghuaiqii]MBC9732389.1 GNAT family N-acetyltransferase [Nocardioides marmotae]MTB83509.1 GNAT family N-acetyltransferase [Nocardioides marmotae]MTB96286.1 GNAT family N-acetyltransferase [Nocardioides marmotae]QKE03223.1 GNAT family N-acetyltransferase [Nocardioides marmotae]